MLYRSWPQTVFFFVYTPISLSLRVESLAEFAKTGDVDPDLRFYFNITGTSAQEQEAFRRALLEQAQVDPVLLSRLFNTDIGEAILETFGEIIQIQRDGNGKYALRGALITAAFEPEGLSLLNFLQELPVNIQIDISQALALSSAVSAVVDATTLITADIARLSLQEVQRNPPDFSQLPDLRLRGGYGVQEREVWNLYDQNRNRKLYALVYKPERYPPGKIPVVIFSHGLASRPEDFAEQARHLASYGYVVVLPNHPGSDINQVRGLIEGFNRDIFVLNEFIDRPLDISFMIDVLESRNQEQFEGRLNLKSVGVAGHSFGGYGALAVAGATLNFDYLEKECSQQFRYLNVSLLLQCRALELPRKEYNFRDERVGAVFVANPVNSAIFGPEGLAKINLPVFLGAGTYDPATPVIFEQARSFPWFTVPNKYLLIIEGQAHVDFSQLDAGLTEIIDSVENLTLPSPYLINSYANAMMTAFFQTYTANNPDYLIYLQPSYAVYLSQGEPFKSYLITSESSDELAQILAQFRDRNPLFR
ncbi:protein of unknown function DUF1400 [Gloeothece citriformis PCC 7424]|uniref:DUF1400 domain-containing protein n=1 Tax=Gloeothece citriformis (strain PCC 7424) TaxID=65393 RepID=B7KAD6_GLOC7|nr:alpha/beta hydrolase [Gloeothece citriformis]ACK72910.1 protein of unknown function DUF1400 [Gloeothece citriformis PCC 7424]